MSVVKVLLANAGIQGPDGKTRAAEMSDGGWITTDFGHERRCRVEGVSRGCARVLKRWKDNLDGVASGTVSF